MRLVLVLSFVVCLVCQSASLSSAAGLKAKGGGVTAEQGWNPNPADTDLVLPMPCDLGMVFVPVDVPVRGFLWDVDFNMGSELNDRPGMEYYDRRFSHAISGPFSAADLPADWRKKLPGKDHTQYYLMGKYEVSVLQWKAVMDGQCPEAPEGEDILPKADVSWYDALEFSRRYMDWLLANKPDALPRFAGDQKNVGHVRLPTEAEWEFAARGGSRVPADALRQQELYALDSGTTLEEYAAYRPDNAARILDKPQRIGSRRPNPLGLYDMAGNVAEMMLDTFHFSLGNRLHGSAGGVVRKGGGFTSSRDAIMPGRRDEMALYTERGPALSRDTGFRLVLSGINTPDGGRADALKKEWAALGEQSDTIAQGANPLQEIDRILELTRDATARENLTTLRGVIKDFNIALEREKDAAVEGLMRSSVYMMETIRNYAVRLNLSHERLAAHQAEQAKEKDASGKVYKTRQAMIKGYEEANAMFREAIEASVLFYRGRLIDLAALDDAAYAHYHKLLLEEFSGADIFKKNMTNNIKTLDKHRTLSRQGKRAELTPVRLRDDILPENLRIHVK